MLDDSINYGLNFFLELEVTISHLGNPPADMLSKPVLNGFVQVSYVLLFQVLEEGKAILAAPKGEQQEMSFDFSQVIF